MFFIHGIAKWNAGLWTSEYHGIKKPSREVFWFLINDNGQLVPPHMEKDRTYNLQKCGNGDIGTSYTDCASIIIKDNWEIKDDYPW